VKTGAKELGKPGRLTEQLMLLYGGCFIIYASSRSHIRSMRAINFMYPIAIAAYYHEGFRLH